MSVIETLAMTDLPVYVQNEMQACHNCGRIDFSSLQCLLPGSQVPQAELMHILDGWLQANSLSSSRRYYGVTRSPLVRMHTCRNGWPAEAGLRDAAGQDPERSHYPTRWSNMSVLFFGDRENILALERVAIRQHQALLSNSVSAAGTGTQQPLLFFYVACNLGRFCSCLLCNAGHVMAYGVEMSQEMWDGDFWMPPAGAHPADGNEVPGGGHGGDYEADGDDHGDGESARKRARVSAAPSPTAAARALQRQRSTRSTATTVLDSSSSSSDVEEHTTASSSGAGRRGCDGGGAVVDTTHEQQEHTTTQEQQQEQTGATASSDGLLALLPLTMKSPHLMDCPPELNFKFGGSGHAGAFASLSCSVLSDASGAIHYKIRSNLRIFRVNPNDEHVDPGSTFSIRFYLPSDSLPQRIIERDDGALWRRLLVPVRFRMDCTCSADGSFERRTLFIRSILNAQTASLHVINEGPFYL